MAVAIQLYDKNGIKAYAAPYWPIGSIYLSIVDTNPSVWFGGTWNLISQGRTLIGVDTSQTDYNTSEKTGGENYRSISHSHGSNTSRNGTLSATIGSANGNSGALGFKHTNDLDVALAGSPTYVVGGSGSSGGWFNHWTQVWGTTSDGGTNSLDMRQPYFTCYIWKRTA